MLNSDGQIKIIHFTFKDYIYDADYEGAVVLGIPEHTAPEQWHAGCRRDERTDIYGVGTTLFHLVTGLNPCELSMGMEPIRTYNPDLSKGLEYIISKCTHPIPMRDIKAARS